jgi:hypothetical protein
MNQRNIRPLSLLFLLLAFSSACALLVPARTFEDSPHVLYEPFLSTWEELDAAGESPGSPRSAVIWLDDRQVQLFDRARLQAAAESSPPLTDDTPVKATPQPAGWLTDVPGDVLEHKAAPYRARLAIASREAAPSTLPVAAPLQPLTATLHIAGYTGPAEIRLYDAEQQPAGTFSARVLGGWAVTPVLPRGALGPQWAVVLVDGRIAGAYSDLFTLEADTSIHTGLADLDMLYPLVRSFLSQNVTTYKLDGAVIRGYRSPDNPLIWLRDHVYQGRGYRYHEPDMTSALDAFRRAQYPDGSFPDVLTYPRLGVQAHRLEPESDLEFLFVQGVHDAWQATGDDAWLYRNLDAMRRALAYITSDPLRWDAELGLVRRPYTIDTWDFEYGPTTIDPTTGNPAPRHWIDEQTRWGIFHGDNTGLAYAMRLMARIERHLGNETRAAYWDEQRRALVERLHDLSWNGDFYTHFVPLEGELDIPGVDTDAQLSLSNTYALNRGVLEFDDAQAVIQSYYDRRDFERAFAEWYSIDPPFPAGSFGMAGRKGEQPGEYVNGGIMPLVGGELARGAFRYGAVDYGFDILHRYADMLQLTGATYLWYHPTGAPGISGPHTLATDGWGSSAMLGALFEGAAGVEDEGSLYRDLKLSPRWAAEPEIDTVRVVTRYAASQGYVAYTWQRNEKSLVLDVTGSWHHARINLLLPREGVGRRQTIMVWLNGETVPTEIDEVAGNRYVQVSAAGGNALVEVEWQ